MVVFATTVRLNGRKSDQIRLGMNKKRASLPQPRPTKTEIEKVSVLMPRSVRRKVEKSAKADRRALSPQIVVLIEAGLAAREVAAA